MNTDAFFSAVNGSLFSGAMTDSQRNGMTVILGAFSHVTDPRWTAYGLATSFHETGQTMQPIREWGLGRGRTYGQPDPTTGQTYYGRGLVQLTWLTNYRQMGAILGVDLVNDPDLALQPAIAAEILFAGMTRGTFTGRNLADYFNATTDDPVNARRIINGTDKADLIAGYHRLFLAALKGASA